MEINTAKFNISFFFALLLCFMAIYTSNVILNLSYVALIVFYSSWSIYMGLAALLLILPLAGSTEIPYLDLICLSVFLFIYFFKALKERQLLPETKYNWKFAILLLVCLFSSIVTGYVEYIHVSFLFLVLFLFTLVIVKLISLRFENFVIIANALIYSGLVAAITSYVKIDQYKRLALAENVRDLANIVGLALILLVFVYFIKSESIKSYVAPKYALMRKLKWPIILILSIGLITTISRGAIIAVSAAIGVGLIFYLIKLNKLNFLKTFFYSLVILSIISVYLLYLDEIFDLINFRKELLISRFSETEVEGGAGIRRKIWEAGISGLEGNQILYGHGFSSFRMLATRNGYNFYPHSPFVDTLVTAGILGLLILLSFIKSIAKNIWRTSEPIVLAIFIYLILNYLTHGSMRSFSFWLVIGLGIGLGEYFRSTKRNKIIKK